MAKRRLASARRRSSLARYRLRFLLHEMDIPQGELLIGRSANCELTIDDPLVSRNHARLLIVGDEAFIEDAGSRNGIRVNGRTITGRTRLTDGARFRIGTQELVLRQVEEATVQAPRRRSTGFMIHCTSCGLPYSTEALECPNCGKDHEDEPTTTTEQAWSIELVAETMHRARSLGKSDTLERLLVQARSVLESTSVTVDRRRLDQLADGAIRHATDSGDFDWARWALGLYSKRGMAPGPEVGQQLGSLPPPMRETLAPEAVAVVRSLRPPFEGGEDADDETMEVLRRIASGASGAG